jgi:hypothetical protein
VTASPLQPAADILFQTDRSSVFSPAFPVLNLINDLCQYLLFYRPSGFLLRQDIAASSGAIIAKTRMPAIMHAAIFFVLVLLKFILILLAKLCLFYRSYINVRYLSFNYKALQFSLQGCGIL